MTSRSTCCCCITKYYSCWRKKDSCCSRWSYRCWGFDRSSTKKDAGVPPDTKDAWVTTAGAGFETVCGGPSPGAPVGGTSPTGAGVGGSDRSRSCRVLENQILEFGQLLYFSSSCAMELLLQIDLRLHLQEVMLRRQQAPLHF